MAQDAKPTNPVAEIRVQMDHMEDQFRAALPSHVPVERFKRVLMTAVQQNPALATADRRSLWNSAMRAAQDGLLPDGREGAIVIYRSKEKTRDGREAWIEKAQWMPMVFGIMKKVRNSGEIASITARVVYEGDTFRYWIDDSGEHVEYEPADNPNRNVVRRVFAMAKTKDGELYVEPLTADEIEKVRAVSRARDSGPWKDWWEEMAKKTAIRRLAKRLPMSTDLDDLIRRDDDLYDFAGASDAQVKPARRTLGESLDALATGGTAAIEHQPAEPVDLSTGEVREAEPVAAKAEPKTEQKTRRAEARKADAAPPERAEDVEDAQTIAEDAADAPADEADDFPGDQPIDGPSPTDEAFRRGYEARSKGVARKAVPGEFRANEDLAGAWVDGWLKRDAELKG